MSAVKNPVARKLAGKRDGAGDEGNPGASPTSTRDDITLGDGMAERSIDPRLADRLRALAIGNGVRAQRAQIKRDLLAGVLWFDDLLTDLPPVCANVSILNLVQWAPYVCEPRARALLSGLVEDLTLPALAVNRHARGVIASKLVEYQASWLRRQARR